MSEVFMTHAMTLTQTSCPNNLGTIKLGVIHKQDAHTATELHTKLIATAIATLQLPSVPESFLVCSESFFG